MAERGWRHGRVFVGTLAAVVGATVSAVAQGPSSTPPVLTISQLVRMSPAELDCLYDQAPAAPMLDGRVPGRAIVFPGKRLAGPASGAARLVWQGKEFRAADATATNRFFGVPAIWGVLYYGPSWRDGRPALILDYQATSRVYEPYRDEIRQVAPGLFLGLMYERTCPQPTLKMYFALECPCP
jgi:hypothetical protein